VNPMLRTTRIPTGRQRSRSGRFRFMRNPVLGVAAALLASTGLGWAALGPAAGIAHAGAFHWCPGDPLPRTLLPNTNNQWLTINPAWDSNVCHDYVISGGHVEEGIPCTLPQFQWFQCPPGTTPMPLMKPVPNKGE